MYIVTCEKQRAILVFRVQICYNMTRVGVVGARPSCAAEYCTDTPRGVRSGFSVGSHASTMLLGTRSDRVDAEIRPMCQLSHAIGATCVRSAQVSPVLSTPTRASHGSSIELENAAA